MPATHTEKCWALSTHALIDRLAGKMEMKADRKLTYAYSTHEDTFMQLCAHTQTHACVPHSHTTALCACIPAIFFLEPKSGERHTWIFLYIMLLNSAVIPNGILTPSDCQSFLLTRCAALAKWPWCFRQAAHSCGAMAGGQVCKDGARKLPSPVAVTVATMVAAVERGVYSQRSFCLHHVLSGFV